MEDIMPAKHRSPGGHDQAMADLIPALNAHSEAVVLFHSSVAQSMGLDPTAYKALFLLNRLGPLSAGDLSRETGLATASVTDLIDRLVAKGYVSRGPHPTDRRRIVVTLIEASVTGARRDFGVPNPSLAELCKRYDVQELALIADFLTRNAQRLREDLAHALDERR
jgi:DNA-binding MarR family transcriptional regulator